MNAKIEAAEQAVNEAIMNLERVAAEENKSFIFSTPAGHTEHFIVKSEIGEWADIDEDGDFTLNYEDHNINEVDGVWYSSIGSC